MVVMTVDVSLHEWKHINQNHGQRLPNKKIVVDHVYLHLMVVHDSFRGWSVLMADGSLTKKLSFTLAPPGFPVDHSVPQKSIAKGHGWRLTDIVMAPWQGQDLQASLPAKNEQWPWEINQHRSQHSLRQVKLAAITGLIYTRSIILINPNQLRQLLPHCFLGIAPALVPSQSTAS